LCRMFSIPGTRTKVSTFWSQGKHHWRLFSIVLPCHPARLYSVPTLSGRANLENGVKDGLNCESKDFGSPRRIMERMKHSSVLLPTLTHTWSQGYTNPRNLMSSLSSPPTILACLRINWITFMCFVAQRRMGKNGWRVSFWPDLISLTRNVTRSLLQLPLAQVERQAKLFRAWVRGREHAPRNSLW